MNRPSSRIYVLIQRLALYGRQGMASADQLKELLSNVQELERIAECRPVASYAAGVKAGKREAYEHALTLVNKVNAGYWTIEDLWTGLSDALDTDGDT